MKSNPILKVRKGLAAQAIQIRLQASGLRPGLGIGINDSARGSFGYRPP